MVSYSPKVARQIRLSYEKNQLKYQLKDYDEKTKRLVDRFVLPSLVLAVATLVCTSLYANKERFDENTRNRIKKHTLDIGTATATVSGLGLLAGLGVNFVRDKRIRRKRSNYLEYVGNFKDVCL